jgi:hypothetical protein
MWGNYIHTRIVITIYLLNFRPFVCVTQITTLTAGTLQVRDTYFAHIVTSDALYPGGDGVSIYFKFTFTFVVIIHRSPSTTH